MYLTEDQRFFLSVLRETGCVRKDQVLPLLRLHTRGKEQYHADAMLRNLRYQGQAIIGNDSLIRLPGHRDTRQDTEVLLALDVLIALSPKRLLQVSGRSEFYPLCFLLEREDGWTDHFAFVSVPQGHEARIGQLLQAEPVEYVFLIYLDSLEQHKSIRILRSHYFIVRQGETLRFYKGGDARK